jgi:hypothetical protein
MGVGVELEMGYDNNTGFVTLIGFVFGASSRRLFRKGNLNFDKALFWLVLSLLVSRCVSDIDDIRARFDRRAPGSSGGTRSSVTGVDSDDFGSPRKSGRLVDGLERATIVFWSAERSWYLQCRVCAWKAVETIASLMPFGCGRK